MRHDLPTYSIHFSLSPFPPQDALLLRPELLSCGCIPCSHKAALETKELPVLGALAGCADLDSRSPPRQSSGGRILSTLSFALVPLPASSMRTPSTSERLCGPLLLVWAAIPLFSSRWCAAAGPFDPRRRGIHMHYTYSQYTSEESALILAMNGGYKMRDFDAGKAFAYILRLLTAACSAHHPSQPCLIRVLYSSFLHRRRQAAMRKQLCTSQINKLASKYRVQCLQLCFGAVWFGYDINDTQVQVVSYILYFLYQYYLPLSVVFVFGG